MTELRQVRDYLREAAAQLGSRSDSPNLDAQVLMSWATGMPRTKLLAHDDTLLPAEQAERFEWGMKRIKEGEPLPYVIGRWEFYGLAFEVTPQVLIPRPETELLVEQGIAWLRKYPERRSAIDIGTGTGCIAVSLAYAIPDLQVTAADISQAALAVAQRNAQLHHAAERVDVIRSDLFESLPGQYDLVCANLPYIPTQVLHSLAIYEREPALALDGGPDGMVILRRFFEQAPAHLAPGGLLLAEIEANQGGVGVILAQKAFVGAEVALLQDLAGWDRVIKVLSEKDHHHE